MRDKSMLILIRAETAFTAIETALFAFLSTSSRVTKSSCSKISMSISTKTSDQSLFMTSRATRTKDSFC